MEAGFANRRGHARCWPLALLLCLSATRASGADLGTFDGFDVRLDTSVQILLGARVASQSATLLADINADDGDRAFRPGINSERLDVTTQLNVTRGDLGLAVSADGWYDAIYHQADANHDATTFNPVTVAPDRFPADVRRLMGNTAELQNAYLHDKADVFGVPVTLRLGRQTLRWGESLFFPQDGIAAGQSPIDEIKQASQPLIEDGALYLPVDQADLRALLPYGLSLEAYDQFEWRRDRIPGVASFFSTTDILDAGGQRLLLDGGRSLFHATDRTGTGSGQYGVALRCDTDTLGLGIYALRYTAQTPQAVLGAQPGSYILVYPRGIDLLGLSASTYLGEDTLSGEVSIRDHTPLASRFQPLAPAVARLPPGYATGRTLQVLASYEAILPRLSLWDSADLQAEAAATDLLGVASGAAARLPGTNHVAVATEAVFTPTWFQVRPDIDVSMPLGVEIGVAGLSSVDPGQDVGTGDLSAGVTATYRSAWTLGLAYTHFIGSPLADRDFVALSLSRAF